MKKFKVAVQETSICYYTVEAKSRIEAELMYMDGDCVSTKHKDEVILWTEDLEETVLIERSEIEGEE
jgi:hypothetical protein